MHSCFHLFKKEFDVATGWEHSESNCFSKEIIYVESFISRQCTIVVLETRSRNSSFQVFYIITLINCALPKAEKNPETNVKWVWASSRTNLYMILIAT